jgi:hypothetical protein
MTLEIPTDETIVYVYSQEPVYPICGNCQHLLNASNNLHYCNNPETEDYLLDGLQQPILQPDKWNCPLHQFKAEG